MQRKNTDDHVVFLILFVSGRLVIGDWREDSDIFIVALIPFSSVTLDSELLDC